MIFCVSERFVIEPFTPEFGLLSLGLAFWCGLTGPSKIDFSHLLCVDIRGTLFMLIAHEYCSFADLLPASIYSLLKFFHIIKFFGNNQ